jgi:hypothetical protein
MLGPVLLTTLIIGWGALGWLLLGGLFLVAGLVNGPVVRWAQTHRDDMSTPAVRCVT